MNLISSFLQNAKECNELFQFSPLLYGSLGLSILLEEELHPDDIDILIPEHFLQGDWNLFKEGLEKLGYVLIDEKEHTFLKDEVKYSYASLENLEPFASIPLEEVKTVQQDHISYKILDLSQYLKVYEASSKDGYRIHKKEKKDYEKIELIKQKLKS